MVALLFGAAGLVLLIYLLRGNLRLDSKTMTQVMNTSLVVALGGIAIVLFLRGLFAAGVALTAVAVLLNFVLSPRGRFARGPASGAMNRAEALAVLGLSEGASADDVRAAHRRLINQAHPDHGGTDYLAAKINQAKDVLLGP